MFGFLKDKLKSWIDKAKESIEKKAEVAKPTKEKPKKEKEKKIKPERAKEKIKHEKKKRTPEELKQEREVTEEVLTDISKEKLEIKTPEEKFEEETKAKEEEIEEETKGKLKPEETEGVLGKEEKKEKAGFFTKLKKFFNYQITETDFEEMFSDLELSFLENNVALEVVEKIKSDLKKELVDKEISKSDLEKEIKQSLKKALENIIIQPKDIIKEIKSFRKENPSEPYKILFFGINGAGKTTSIAKFASLCLKNKLSVALAAGDTFRAASIEQIQIHADKLGVKLIKHDYGSDPSAVAFDAIKYAQSNNIDVVLIDTAGRMHTKENLLQEMEKIARVSKPNLKVFVAESIAGNDATEQAKAFNDMIHIDGTILSKADVDEKGGSIISISFITQKPILYLGVGQAYEELEFFNKNKFIERLGL